jgi:hypothetical protein
LSGEISDEVDQQRYRRTLSQACGLSGVFQICTWWDGRAEGGVAAERGDDKLDICTFAALTLLLAVFCTYTFHLGQGGEGDAADATGKRPLQLDRQCRPVHHARPGALSWERYEREVQQRGGRRTDRGFESGGMSGCGSMAICSGRAKQKIKEERRWWWRAGCVLGRGCPAFIQELPLSHSIKTPPSGLVAGTKSPALPSIT